MAVVQKTYAELGELWGVSKEAARKKVEGLRLPRKPGNDGKTRVTIDLTEVTHTPKSVRPETDGRPAGDHPETEAGDHQEDDRRTTPEVLALLGQVAALEARAADLAAELERERLDRTRERGGLVDERDREREERLAERGRADALSIELVELAKRFTAMTDEGRARETALQSKIDAAQTSMAELRARPWWRRLAG